MLARLISLLGWRTARSKRRPPYQAHQRTASATAHLFVKKSGPATKGTTATARPAPQKGKAGSAANADFNPYNTGKFDRSASWERISKSQR